MSVEITGEKWVNFSVEDTNKDWATRHKKTEGIKIWCARVVLVSLQPAGMAHAKC